MFFYEFFNFYSTNIILFYKYILWKTDNISVLIIVSKFMISINSVKVREVVLAFYKLY